MAQQKEYAMNNKKNLWIAGGILLILALCGLLAWLGGGMVQMIQAHLGI
jgi:hypothetical protein